MTFSIRGWGDRQGLFQSGPGTLNPTISVPNSTAVPLPLGNAMQHWTTSLVISDPDGWLAHDYTIAGTDPNNAWGTTVPTGHAVMLPPGTYLANIIGRFTAVPEYVESPAKYAYVILDQAEYDYQRTQTEGSTYDVTPGPGWWYDFYLNPATIADVPMVAYGLQPTSNKYYSASSILVNDRDEPAPFTMWAWAIGQTVTRVIDYYSCQIVRIA